MIELKCQDCEWEASWEGGAAYADPALDHAIETGHTVTAKPEARQ